jgi:hypothetical protein
MRAVNGRTLSQPTTSPQPRQTERVSRYKKRTGRTRLAGLVYTSHTETRRRRGGRGNRVRVSEREREREREGTGKGGRGTGRGVCIVD